MYGWKIRGEWKIDGFRKRLMIPESEIAECPEFEVFVKHLWTKKYLKNIVSEFTKLILFYEYDKTKIKVNKNGCEDIE